MEDFYSKGKFMMNGETLDGYCHIIDEEIEKESSRKYSPIDLSSFKPQKELNPKVWVNGDKMNSKVRNRLLKIADDFWDSLGIKWAETQDVILTGSLANYNWSEFSDFDLHLIVDFNNIDKRTNFVKDFFDAKKKIWNDSHSDLKIYGFPVEIYVQDSSEKHTSSGMYSLERNTWIRKPEIDSIKAIKLEKYYIKEKAMSLMKKIDDICDGDETAENAEKASELFKKIKSIRRDALSNGNEMSPGNIIFKILRRSGHIEKLSEMKNKFYDRVNSIG